MPDFERDELERVSALLGEMADPFEVPDALERRTLGAIGRSTANRDRRPAPRWSARSARRGWALAAAALVIGAFALSWIFRDGDRGRAGPLAPKVVLRADLRAPDGGRPRAEAEVVATGIGRVVELRARSLPSLPEGEDYELWFVDPGHGRGPVHRTSAGTFRPDARGRSVVRFAAVDPTRYPVLAVTAEPRDGNPWPTGPVVLRSRA